jgi:hypothetical protein
MNVVFIKDWFNPDTGKTVKKGAVVDIIDWKLKELESDGFIQIPEPVQIKDTTKKVEEKEFKFEEITNLKIKRHIFNL